MSDEKGTLTRDPELAAMAKADKILSGLSSDAAARVTEFLHAKYNHRKYGGPPGDPMYRRGIDPKLRAGEAIRAEMDGVQ